MTTAGPLSIASHLPRRPESERLTQYAWDHFQDAFAELRRPVRSIHVTLSEIVCGGTKILRCSVAVATGLGQPPVYLMHEERDHREAVRTAARLALWHTAQALRRQGVRRRPLAS